MSRRLWREAHRLNRTSNIGTLAFMPRPVLKLVAKAGEIERGEGASSPHARHAHLLGMACASRLLGEKVMAREYLAEAQECRKFTVAPHLPRNGEGG